MCTVSAGKTAHDFVRVTWLPSPGRALHAGLEAECTADDMEFILSRLERHERTSILSS